MVTLFDYQAQAERDIFNAFKGLNAACAVLPTGAGKTVLGASIVRRVAERGRRVFVLAHRNELVDQLSDALTAAGVEHGQIRPDVKESPASVQVAMVQTLARRIRLDKSGRYRADLTLVDECHHAIPDNQWGAVIQHLGGKLLGLTATPARLDGKGLGSEVGGFFQALVLGPTMSELIERGRLSRFSVFPPAQDLDLTGVKVRGGDFDAKQTAAALEKARINPVPRYRELLGGAPSIAFTFDVKESERVVALFKEAGYQAAALTGKTTRSERRRLLADLGRGELNVLASCNVISEGTDVPAVTGALLLRPTASLSLDWQQKGRVLRVAADKHRALILDFVNNTDRHGLPTDAVQWSLNTTKTKGVGKPKLCLGCKTYLPAGVFVCERCGVQRSSKERSMEQQLLDLADAGLDIRLVELTPEMRQVIKSRRHHAEKLARSVDDLRVIGEACGYKPKWADYRASELGLVR